MLKKSRKNSSRHGRLNKLRDECKVVSMSKPQTNASINNLFESVQEIAAKLSSSNDFTYRFQGDMDKFNTDLSAVALAIINAVDVISSCVKRIANLNSLNATTQSELTKVSNLVRFMEKDER